MSLTTFNDAPLVSISGPVSITKDVQNNAAGSLVVAGSIVASGGLSVSGSLTGVSLTAASALTVSTGLSITAGGETITAGGLSITAGGETITAGGLSITAGGATIAGGASIDKITGGTSAVQTIATTGGTITVASKVAKVAQTTGGVITSATLNAGVDGQECHVINENAAGASTLIINTGITVASGTTSVTISGLAAKKFIFDATAATWFTE